MLLKPMSVWVEWKSRSETQRDYTHNEILLGHKNSAICINIDGPREFMLSETSQTEKGFLLTNAMISFEPNMINFLSEKKWDQSSRQGLYCKRGRMTC